MEPSSTNARGNALGVVDESGTVQMLCGTTAIQLSATAEESVRGQVVRIAGTDKGQVRLTAQTGSVSGDLDVNSRTLGRKPLADSVLIFDKGALTSLSQLTSSVIKESRIKYARTNWAGEVDLIVLDLGTGEIYGRVFWESDRIPVYDDDGNPTGDVEYDERLGIEYGSGSSDRVGPFRMKYNVRSGDYAAVKINRGGNGFSMLVKLTKLKDVSNSAWLGRSAVTFGGKTYDIPADVLCYNLDTQDWVTLDQALAYSDSANLYVKDGVVRVVEVYH